MANELTTADLPIANFDTMPKKLRKWLREYSDLGNSTMAVESETRVGIWKQLRIEAASALLARVELEKELNIQSTGIALSSREDDETESKDLLEPPQSFEGDETDKLTVTDTGPEQVIDGSLAESLEMEPDTREEQTEDGDVLWTRASLETAQREQRELIKELNHLKSQLLLEQSELAILKQKNIKLSDRLAEAEYELIATEQEFKRENRDLESEQGMLDNHYGAKKQNARADGDYMLERLESHSRQLANMKASLIEQDIELQHSRQQNLKSEQELIRVKRLASMRIKQLEAQLSELQSDNSDQDE
jgi:hypothetical protein